MLPCLSAVEWELLPFQVAGRPDVGLPHESLCVAMAPSALSFDRYLSSGQAQGTQIDPGGPSGREQLPR
jgi:hypothetical protein